MKFIKLYKEHINWEDFDYEEEDIHEFIDFPEYLSNEDAIGKRVKIKPGTIYYNRGNKTNPINTIGIIQKLRYGYGNIFKVLWDNETSNVYNRTDLIIQI